ncbi:hypothetical protein BKA70DRAFT_1152426 [Coprinopsis sp. MPI-PUGE-AT-0042]|nr:hypothetical protein BKA70DRAFT_1152426 [Coprinopsis sp. MPI-PUGE-AT-0042]
MASTPAPPNLGPPTSVSTSIPSALYETLLLKLTTVLEITRESEGVKVNVEARQRLLTATNDFKNSLLRAKELAENIPGGEFTVEEQDEVVKMLEVLRDRKKARLEQFSARTLASSAHGYGHSDAKMEVDSVASTPFGG